MKEALDLLTGLGPTGLFAAAAYQMWRERNEALAALLAEKHHRLEDARAGTTALLAVVERVHTTIDRLEDRP